MILQGSLNQDNDESKFLLHKASFFCNPNQTPYALKEIKSGNINSTFLINSQGGFNFIFQKINTHVFKDIYLLAKNSESFTSHLNSRLNERPEFLIQRRWEIPSFMRLISNGNHYIESNGGFWRAIKYIGDSINITDNLSGDDSAEAGFALAVFHYLSSDYRFSTKGNNTFGLHDIEKHLKKYRSSISSFNSSNISKDLSQRLKCITSQIDSMSNFALSISNNNLLNIIPLRTVHGDPKITNFLFDSYNRKAIGLIDLDTINYGYIGHDIADCVRSCCNQLGENHFDVEEVSFDLQLFERFIEGYMSVPNNLKDTDYKYLPSFIILIPLELSIRFLSDYLCGNKYFKVDRPEINLKRAEVQIKLVQNIQSKIDLIIDIIAKYRTY